MTRLTEEKFQDIKRAADLASGYSLWDLRLLIEEVDRLKEKLESSASVESTKEQESS